MATCPADSCAHGKALGAGGDPLIATTRSANKKLPKQKYVPRLRLRKSRRSEAV